jgi:chromosome segregation and condensation protein ScpB
LDLNQKRTKSSSVHGLIATGPRAPSRGAPYTFVTTDAFLAAFGMESLRDLPDPEQLGDAGLAARP